MEEVDLCGHATIATYALLLKNNIIKPGEDVQELKADILKFPVEWITSTKLIPEIISTGLNNVMIPIATREKLFSIKLDDERISHFQKEYGAYVYI